MTKNKYEMIAPAPDYREGGLKPDQCGRCEAFFRTLIRGCCVDCRRVIDRMYFEVCS